MQFSDLIPADLGLPVLAALTIAAFVAGLARGFSGFGSALIFMPLASAAIGARVASPASCPARSPKPIAARWR